MKGKVIFENGEIFVIQRDFGYFVSINGKEELEKECFDEAARVLGEKTDLVYELDICGNFYKIYNDSFVYFKNLKRLRIPKSVIYIDSNALSTLNKIESFEVEEGNERYMSFKGDLYLLGFTSLIKYASGKGDKCFTVPSEVSYICDKAFCFSKNLEKIEIGENVVGVGKYCFLGCENLKEAVLDARISTLERSLFEACVSLEKVKLGKYIKKISKYAFSKCVRLNEIELPEKLEIIDSNAFEDCVGLTKIDIPKGIEEIGYNAFLRCSGLNTVTVPRTIRSLGVYDYEEKSTPEYRFK